MDSAAVYLLGEAYLQKNRKAFHKAKLALLCIGKWVLPLSCFLNWLRRWMLWHKNSVML